MAEQQSIFSPEANRLRDRFNRARQRLINFATDPKFTTGLSVGIGVMGVGHVIDSLIEAQHISQKIPDSGHTQVLGGDETSGFLSLDKRLTSPVSNLLAITVEIPDPHNEELTDEQKKNAEADMDRAYYVLEGITEVADALNQFVPKGEEDKYLDILKKFNEDYRDEVLKPSVSEESLMTNEPLTAEQSAQRANTINQWTAEILAAGTDETIQDLYDYLQKTTDAGRAY